MELNEKFGILIIIVIRSVSRMDARTAKIHYGSLNLLLQRLNNK